MNKKKQLLRNNLRLRRTIRTRSKISGTALRPRVSIYRSLKHTSAQIIDDRQGKTLAAVIDTELKQKKGNKVDKAHEAGKLLAEKAIAKKIKQVVFDRSNYKYHGRVKSFADGLREGGLEF